MSVSHLSRIVCAFTLAAASAAADVLVVGPGPGEIGDPNVAFAAASSGDVVLIRAGTYIQFSDSYAVSDKSLTIVADGTVTMSSLGIVTTAAEQSVVLRGIDLVDTTFFTGASALGFSGPGQLRVEDCGITGDEAISGFLGGPEGTPGVSLFGAGHAAFDECTIRGGKGAPSFPFGSTSFAPSKGGPGITAFDSSVSLHRCTIIGGAGGDNLALGTEPNTFPAPGGSGIDGTDATVLVAGGSVTGGTGGLNDVATGGTGGPGIALTGASELRELLDTSVAGGAGGPDVGSGGAPGVARDVSGSQLVYQATSRDYTIGGPSREGGVVTISYDGEPNDLVGVFVALAPDALPLQSAKGTFLLGSPLLGNLLTLPIDGTGAASFDVPLPDLGFGPDDALVLYEQGFVLGQTDGKVLTGPTVHVVIDDSL